MALSWPLLKTQLKTGEWLTIERLRSYSLIMLALCTIACVAWIALSHGVIDPSGRPIGTDFSSFYAAGSLVLDGRAADVYDMAIHHAREQQIFGAETSYYAWFYPPIFLLIAAPLAVLPYSIALAVWQGSTLLLYLFVIGTIVRVERNRHIMSGYGWILIALAFPAVFVNLGHGQNGFLTSALLGGALIAMPRHQVLSGILFGLLAYKPQFALVIPIALLAASQWRVVLSASLTVVLLVGMTTFLFGVDAWLGFLTSTEMSRTMLLEQGDVGFEKLQSVFAAIRLVGGSVSLAYTLQTTISVLVVCTVAWTWRLKIDDAQKATILAIATLLASPHVLDYDLVTLGVAIAFFVRHGSDRGFRNYEITLLAAVWIVPLIARAVAGMTSVPVGLIAMSAFYLITLRRALSEASLSAEPVAQA